MKLPTKSKFQSEVPVRNGNEISFLGKVIALIIPKDTSNFPSVKRSIKEVYPSIKTKK